jgi:hypothetical protein
MVGCDLLKNDCHLPSQGFDEYMNLVLDDAEEIHSKTKSRKQLGKEIVGFTDFCLFHWQT